MIWSLLMDRSILLHYPSGLYSPCRRAQPWVLLIPRLLQRATWWMPFDLQLRGSGQPGCGECLLNGTLPDLQSGSGSPTDASLGRAHPPSYEVGVLWVFSAPSLSNVGIQLSACTSYLTALQFGFYPQVTWLPATSENYESLSFLELTSPYPVVSPNIFKPSLRGSRGGLAGKSTHWVWFPAPTLAHSHLAFQFSGI